MTLLLIIGGLIRAMAQMKACKFWGQIGQKSDIASLSSSMKLGLGYQYKTLFNVTFVQYIYILIIPTKNLQFH